MPHLHAPGANGATRRTALVFAAALALLALGVLAFAPRPAPPTNRPRVAATIFPLYDIVRTVAGPDVDVTLVLPPGAEPHSFEPQPSTVREIAASGAVYAIGHGFDDWIDSAVTATGTPKVTVDAGIALRAASHAIALGGGPEEEHEGPDDPHYWLTARNGAVIARTVAADLAARFPERAAGFAERGAALAARLDELDAAIAAQLGNRAQKDIVTFHDAWYYFAEAYGLRVVGTFEPSPGREPSPKGLATLRETVRGAGVKTLFVEPLFSDAAVRSFARDEGLDIRAIDDIGGLPGRDTYESLLRSNAQTIAESR